MTPESCKLQTVDKTTLQHYHPRCLSKNKQDFFSGNLGPKRNDEDDNLYCNTTLASWSCCHLFSFAKVRHETTFGMVLSSSVWRFLKNCQKTTSCFDTERRTGMIELQCSMMSLQIVSNAKNMHPVLSQEGWDLPGCLRCLLKLVSFGVWPLRCLKIVLGSAHGPGKTARCE